MSSVASTTKIDTGSVIGKRTLPGARGEKVEIPDVKRLVHLQFRRFAGCAYCNVHLRPFEVRYDEIAAAGIRELVVFRSTQELLDRHHGDVPYTVVLDPTGSLYAEFGVESGLSAVLDPRASLMALPNVMRSLFPRRLGLPASGERFEGLFGFPADFLIATDGRVAACKYGAYAGDGWSVDELLSLARRHALSKQQRIDTRVLR